MYRVEDHPFAGMDVIEKRYEIENAILRAVETGNDAMAFSILKEISESSIFLDSRIPNTMRNIKDYLITLNVLCRKTVERAGVLPIYIDSVSNNFVVFIEQADSTEECNKIIEQIICGSK